MNHIRKHIGRSAMLAMGLALMLSTAPVLTAQAQQAGGGTEVQKPDHAPAPVTPFGPRRKPPRVTPGAAPAARAPRPEIISQHGVWRVVCEKLPVLGKDKKVQKQKICYVSASATDPKRKGLFIIINILPLKDKDGKIAGHMVNLRAPLGVFLPTGIALEVDGKAVTRVPFSRCNQLFCESTGQARKETLAKLRKGRKAKFIVYASPGVGLPVELDLKGFSAALQKLADLK